ncbi:sugar phosphate permease [Desulfosporosinus orientis DSM 765]|uniref:Sugar phosphate permease n=1 Tax=Desulfosporosinus orientis (strain ATCC 19365 / DSM 765 / NCIMB 8382 / VKM B-1628 / Singapore I) TaxID=768706 RepID=G7W6W3_DESOD|nr:MFS transporter [Desulfosporosinus orientis]AET69820.1 sugar phosphate permease [Desulfosporosinus orientis DSM 765]
MEHKAKSKKRYLTLFIMALGASAIYFLPFIRWTYYDSLKQALELNNTQFGTLLSAYGIAAMIFYFPGGWLADRVSARRLLTFAFASTGILGFYFSTYPSFNMLLIVHFIWGIISTLTFWSAMIKATRDLANSDEQGRFFGLLEGGRGLLQTVITMSALAVFTSLGAGVIGLTRVIIIFSFVNVFAAILTWFVLEDTKFSQEQKPVLLDALSVLKMPVVWLIAVIVITCYSTYLGTTYLTPYVTQVLGATAAMSALIAIIRNYGLQFFGGPFGGLVADKKGSSAQIVMYCFAIMLICMVFFLMLPASNSLIIVLLLNMLVMGLAIFMMRGIYFATLDEVGIPSNLTGSVVGIVSLIGFTPDVFFNPVAGHFLDVYPGVAGYKYIFILMTGFVTVGLVASIVLLNLINKSKSVKGHNQVEARG